MRIGFFHPKRIACVHLREERFQSRILDLDVLDFFKAIGQDHHAVASPFQGFQDFDGAGEQRRLVRRGFDVVLAQRARRVLVGRQPKALKGQLEALRAQRGFVHQARPKLGPAPVVGLFVRRNPSLDIGHALVHQRHRLVPSAQGQTRIGFKIPQRVIEVKKQRSRIHETPCLSNQDTVVNAAAHRANASINKYLAAG